MLKLKLRNPLLMMLSLSAVVMVFSCASRTPENLIEKRLELQSERSDTNLIMSDMKESIDEMDILLTTLEVEPALVDKWERHTEVVNAYVASVAKETETVNELFQGYNDVFASLDNRTSKQKKGWVLPLISFLFGFMLSTVIKVIRFCSTQGFFKFLFSNKERATRPPF